MARKLLILLAFAFLSCVPDAPDGDIPTGLSARPDVFAVTLAWDAPTIDAEGSPLTDLAGFRLYFAQTNPPSGSPIETAEPVATASDLNAGTWYFAVTAVDSAGNESDLSEVVAVEVGR